MATAVSAVNLRREEPFLLRVLKEKTKCSILIAVVTVARADQLFLGIARAAGVFTHGCLSLFGVPFRVIIARNAKHSEDGNGSERC
ncbi:hypothetical protein NDU88_006373 [Pleurodeles waltl]|uniref:Uncharacterized protein n=1 Tax=Pleurodeles waltl TaxID=8319 RepID=A0AAV7WDE3_PLEWA|nr:hypothetical protein NDU88_006373 [Pleurodeles waltl]